MATYSVRVSVDAAPMEWAAAASHMTVIEFIAWAVGDAIARVAYDDCAVELPVEVNGHRVVIRHDP